MLVIVNGELNAIQQRNLEKEWNLKVLDRMTSNDLITVKEGTTLDEAKEVLQKYRVEKLLVINV